MNHIESEAIRLYEEGASIKSISKAVGCSEMKVRKILVDAGAALNETAQSVLELYNQGMAPREIASTLGIGFSTVHSYTPYRRGVYYADQPTINAIRIRNMRARRKKTCQRRSY